MYQLGVMGTADLWLTDHLLTPAACLQILPTTTTSLTTPTPAGLALTARSYPCARVCAERVYVNNLQANYFQHLGNGFYGRSTVVISKPCLAVRGQKCCTPAGQQLGVWSGCQLR